MEKEMTAAKPDEWLSLTEIQESYYNKFMEQVSHGERKLLNALELTEKINSVQVGTTPRERVWFRNKASLYRYHLADDNGSLGQTRPRIPLLIIYALINKPYILDLRPNSSFIRYMLERGFDIFLLDWGTPGAEDAEMDLEDYVLEYIPRAIGKMRQITGQDDFSLLGYCMGGTMSAIYAAAHPDDQPKNLILLAAPIDFEKANTFSLWLQEQYFNVDLLVDGLGIIPADLIDYGTKMLKPFQNYVQNYLDLHGKLWDDHYVESWLAMNKWVNDGIPMAGETFRRWVIDFYRNNKLVKGKLTLGGKRVSLKNLDCSLLSIIADRDHLVPPDMSSTLVDMISSEDKTQHIISAGHVGMVAGRGAVTQLWPLIANWLEQRSV
jgi:polyhydroxyalkanoate synthase